MDSRRLEIEQKKQELAKLRELQSPRRSKLISEKSLQEILKNNSFETVNYHTFTRLSGFIDRFDVGIQTETIELRQEISADELGEESTREVPEESKVYDMNDAVDISFRHVCDHRSQFMSEDGSDLFKVFEWTQAKNLKLLANSKNLKEIFAVSDLDGRISVVNAEYSKEVLASLSAKSTLNTISFGLDDHRKLVSVSESGQVTIFDLRSESVAMRSNRIYDWSGTMRSELFSVGGREVLMLSDGEYSVQRELDRLGMPIESWEKETTNEKLRINTDARPNLIKHMYPHRLAASYRDHMGMYDLQENLFEQTNKVSLAENVIFMNSLDENLLVLYSNGRLDILNADLNVKSSFECADVSSCGNLLGENSFILGSKDGNVLINREGVLKKGKMAENEILSIKECGDERFYGLYRDGVVTMKEKRT